MRQISVMGLDKTKKVYLSIVLSVAVLLLFFFNLCFGTVHIPMADVINSLTGRGASLESWDFIIRESRLPSAITALLAGTSLAASGLMLQTAFRNPLAGPDILGINGGAGLGGAGMLERHSRTGGSRSHSEHRRLRPGSGRHHFVRGSPGPRRQQVTDLVRRAMWLWIPAKSL